jgi:hypothetical protein
MTKLAVIVLVTAVTSLALAAAEVEQRTIKTEGGQMALTVPKGWPAPETRVGSRGVPFYRFAPADTNFEFLLYFNYPSSRRTNVLADSGLEGFLKSSLSTLTKRLCGTSSLRSAQGCGVRVVHASESEARGSPITSPGASD